MAGGLMNGGGRSRHSRLNRRPMADINVTPMVDVMLVLLIVFMVAAPLLTVGVPVDLPKTQAPAINEQKEPLVVTVNGQGQIYVQETPIEADALLPKLQAITENNQDATIYVRGDKAINYGRVMEVMGLIASAGYTKVSLIAELPQSGGKAPAKKP
ncbi:protein TolR [Aliidongia dinghuensis]|uniref:Protein TolR n=1 Tax=Aliidongia dinghuensis TaxID=1867774 RepID=A0A8J3E375_9PROT|nr:protein TolR [Aliidongia dinghuensis]GGF16875.1 protein TolR [Aliidongia dinghuensis]